MKIHLMGPIDGNKSDYAKIIEIVESLGHEMVTRHVLERKMAEVEKETPQEAALAAKKIQQWIKTAEVVIFEASKPDVSLGYEVATALHLGKPAIVLYRANSGSVPHGLKGINSDKLQVDSYDDDTLAELLKVAVEYAQDVSDIRFNFFISPSLSNYLDWISQNKKVPRSVYLRELIERDMERNKEYKES
jgi:hypothetical protein